MVLDPRFRVKALGFRVWGLGFRGTLSKSEEKPMVTQSDNLGSWVAAYDEGTLFPTNRFNQGDPQKKPAKGHYSGT